MNQKLLVLARRRHLLITQVAAQRAILAQNIVLWHKPLSLVDRGFAALRFVKRHPLLMLGGTTLLAKLRPGISTKWIQRGLLAWQFLRKLRNP